MSIEIPLKRKYTVYTRSGYRRQHNGNGARKPKKGMSLDSVKSYDRTKHILNVNGKTGHGVMIHLP